MLSKRKIKERELRKKQIFDGALKVFKLHGIEKTTMDEIAHESGFGKATIYYYYAYINFEMYYTQKGQIKKAIECVKKENEALRERDFAGLKEIYNELWYAKYYISLGWYDKAKELLDRIKENTIEEERYYVEKEYANLYYETKNIKGLEAFREIAINKLNSTGKEWYGLMELAELNGKIEKIKGNYQGRNTKFK